MIVARAPFPIAICERLKADEAAISERVDEAAHDAPALALGIFCDLGRKVLEHGDVGCADVLGGRTGYRCRCRGWADAA